MTNFVFISPNYPDNYWLFVQGLKKAGARVLCIIDTDYNNLHPGLKENMDECFKVSSFHNYDEVFKAVAYFSWKYGKIDWIESSNEAWLDLDARLRDDFNVKTGFNHDTIQELQSKAGMKKYYEKAGIPVAPYCLPVSFEEADHFGSRYGYNLVLKPDHGVGASFTYHIHNSEELRHFWDLAEPLGTQMILEEFIPGDVVTLDGVAGPDGRIKFIASLEYVSNCMDSVQNQDSIGCYYTFGVSPENRALAQNVVDAFGLKNRFFHGEYFRLPQDEEGVGRKGDLVGLEVNFRPPGGFAPDLINYSYDVNIYDLWARALMGQDITLMEQAPHSAGFVGRRSSVDYRVSLNELQRRYGSSILGVQVLPPAFAATMGDVTIKARFENAEERNNFFRDTFEHATIGA